MKKLFFILLLLITEMTVFAQVDPADWGHAKGGYLASTADSVIIRPPSYFQYNMLVITDTTNSVTDSVWVYVSDLYYGEFAEVAVRAMSDWTDYSLATTTTVNVGKRYLILSPFVKKIKLVKSNSGSVIKWAYEGH